MKKLFACFALLFGLSSVAHAADTPVDLVRDTSRQALEMLSKDNGKNSAKVREQLINMVTPKFDFQRMTALAVGKDWRAATPAQKQQLAKEFETLLVGTYSATMTRFKNAQIEIKPNVLLNNEGREAVVKSEVTLPGSAEKKPINVDYTLYKTPQGWKVFNVTVEGGSLVTIYRNQFGEQVRKSGIDGLIKSLQDKNSGAKAA